MFLWKFQEKCIDNISSKSQKRQRLIALILVFTIPRHPEEQHLPFKQTGTTIIFHTDTNPVFPHVLIHSFNKAHVLVVTVELIWLLLLNILSFNFVLTPNKFLVGQIRKSLCKVPCYHSNHHYKLYSVFAWCVLHCSK